MVAPGFLVLGLMLIPVGMMVERRRRLRQAGAPQHFPQLDLNNPAQRSTVAFVLSFVVVFSLISAVGSYKAYEFTDSVQFCGQLCHTVMHPEFTAYQASPHARVGCVECHVGSGAGWYVKSKLSGARQVYYTAMGTFPRPIPTPVAQPASGAADLRTVPLAEEVLGRAAEDLHPLRRRRAEHAARDSPADQDRRRRSVAGPGGRRHPLAHEHRQQDHLLCHRRAAADHSLGAHGRPAGTASRSTPRRTIRPRRSRSTRPTSAAWTASTATTVRRTSTRRLTFRWTAA